MYWYEATITLLVKQTFSYRDVPEQIGRFISRSMLLDTELKKLHEAKGYKPFHYSGLFPVEVKTKVYPAGNVYHFRLRSIDLAFFNKIIHCIRQANDDLFHILSVEKREFKKKLIQELKTITPFIVTVDGRPWMPDQHDIELLIERLQANAEKKYKAFFGEEAFPQRFIQRIEVTNRKPIGLNYKNIRLLGHKATLMVNEDEQSQKLAAVVLGLGLAEKTSSLGAGFCQATFI